LPGDIFINYRRDDAQGTAGRLRDRLVRDSRSSKVFMDVDNIPAGVDFVDYLNDQVAGCDVLLAIIGPNWLHAKDETGQRRLDNTGDYVRVEIAAALTRKIRVVPVLVDGARLPKVDELPDDLKSLVRRNAIEVRNTQFGRDADALADNILEERKPGAAWTGRWIALVGRLAGQPTAAGQYLTQLVQEVEHALPGQHTRRGHRHRTRGLDLLDQFGQQLVRASHGLVGHPAPPRRRMANPRRRLCDR